MKVLYFIFLGSIFVGCTAKNTKLEPISQCEVDRISWCIIGTNAKVSFEPVANQPLMKWIFTSPVGNYQPFEIFEHSECVGLENPIYQFKKLSNMESNFEFRSKSNPQCYLRLALPLTGIDREIAIDLFRSSVQICSLVDQQSCKMKLVPEGFFELL